MQLTVKPAEGYTVLEARGKLTATQAPILKHTIDELIQGGKSRIVIDLGGMEFIDSSGLGALIGSLKATRLANGDLRIAAVPDSVRRVLKLTNLDRVLRDYPTAEAAFDGD